MTRPLVTLDVNVKCVIPENIHTPSTDGQWKFVRGGGGGGGGKG